MIPAAEIEEALPPEIIRCRANSEAALRVNAADGTIQGVSLMTIGPAKGWPFFIDGRSLDTLEAALRGSPVQSYLKHDDGEDASDRTGEEIGTFDSYTRQGDKVVANFSALDAFRKHDLKSYDHLFELAAKAPLRVGVSPVFKYTLAWPVAGADVPAKAAMSEGRVTFIPPRPPGAPNALPSVRITEVLSADFVDRPAANRGLFRASGVDAVAKVVPPAQSNSQRSPMKLAAEIYAKFSDHPKRLARALELHKTDEALSLDAIVSKVEHERTEGELAELREGHATLTKSVEDATAKLKAKDEEIAKLKEQAGKDAEAIAALRKSGAAPVKTGEGGGDGGGDGTMARADWAKLSARKQSDFILKGGVLTD